MGLTQQYQEGRSWMLGRVIVLGWFAFVFSIGERGSLNNI